MTLKQTLGGLYDRLCARVRPFYVLVATTVLLNLSLALGGFLGSLRGR